MEQTAFSYNFFITTDGFGVSSYVVILIVLIFTYILLVIGVAKEELVLVTLAAMVLTVVGIYIQLNGIADMKNWVTDAFGMVNWAIGVYILVRAYGEEAVSLLGG